MADIFLSYGSKDRPRAETLRQWFEAAGWSVWIDRELEIGDSWQRRIEHELAVAKAVVVIWGPDARRSDWVVREASAGLESGRLVQIHATGLPLLPPFDAVQGVRMMTWSQDARSHGQKHVLMTAVAQKLNVSPPAPEPDDLSDRDEADSLDLDAFTLVQSVLEYCTHSVEVHRLSTSGQVTPGDWEQTRILFDAILQRVARSDAARESAIAVFEPMLSGFLDELQLLAPDPHLLT